MTSFGRARTLGGQTTTGDVFFFWYFKLLSCEWWIAGECWWCLKKKTFHMWQILLSGISKHGKQPTFTPISNWRSTNGKLLVVFGPAPGPQKSTNLPISLPRDLSEINRSTSLRLWHVAEISIGAWVLWHSMPRTMFQCVGQATLLIHHMDRLSLGCWRR